MRAKTNWNTPGSSAAGAEGSLSVFPTAVCICASHAASHASVLSVRAGACRAMIRPATNLCRTYVGTHV